MVGLKFQNAQRNNRKMTPTPASNWNALPWVEWLQSVGDWKTVLCTLSRCGSIWAGCRQSIQGRGPCWSVDSLMSVRTGPIPIALVFLIAGPSRHVYQCLNPGTRFKAPNSASIKEFWLGELHRKVELSETSVESWRRRSTVCFHDQELVRGSLRL